MSKLTVEDKRKIISLYKEGYGNRIIARKMNISRTRVLEILNTYNLYGDIVLEVSHTKRKYTIEFKIDLIHRVNNGESIHSIAAKYMISPG